ncbi:YopX family protein [Paenibacillus sp. T2-29]
MRDIKFRGKKINGTGWVYGYYVYQFEIGYYSQGYTDVPPRVHYIFGDKGDFCEVDPATVGQYTGLKDRNGKEAYHKDIVDYDDCLYVIEWDEKTTGFYLAYIPDLHDPESEEHLKGSCITLSTIKSHALETGKLLQGENKLG